MQRRKFLFRLSLGLFQIGELFGIDGLDRLAAAVINSGNSKEDAPRDADCVGAASAVVEDDSEEEAEEEEADEGEPGEPNEKRRARDGRPPSLWLRSLNAEELRVWLPTIDPPEAGVQGMTFRTHLTRDHSFEAAKIKGLTEAEQAKLHAAAHDGY